VASFYGREQYAIDHKGRLSVPAPMRRDVSGRKPITHFFIAPGFDGCLALYSPDEWKRVEDQLRALPMGDREARAFARAFLSDVSKVAVDSQGRITIPSSLLNRAGLGKDAILHGVLNRIEIWSPERFQQEKDAAEGKLEEFAARLFGGNR
jgi:transcriptional regulator MraZ